MSFPGPAEIPSTEKPMHGARTARLEIPTPRQKRPEHPRAQRRMRDPELLRRTEEEPRLETEIDPVRRAEALRDPESGDAGRQPELAGQVPIRRHVAAPFDERAAHAPGLSVHELRRHVGW